MEEKYIDILLKLVDKAYQKEESPVAAIIVHHNKVIAKGFNKRNKSKYTISHAEIEAINRANKKLKDWRLNNCTMYVTMKPCEMCEKVIKEARINKVYYLVDRDINKHQYSKGKLIKLENKEYTKKYQEILATFWQNKRPKKQQL